MTDTLEFRTLTGATVRATLTSTGLSEARIVARAVATGARGEISGWLNAPHPVGPDRMPATVALRELGASHYCSLDVRGGETAIVALDAETAERVSGAFAAAQGRAIREHLDEVERQRAEIVATHEIVRALVWAGGGWPNELCEMYRDGDDWWPLPTPCLSVRDDRIIVEYHTPTFQALWQGGERLETGQSDRQHIRVTDAQWDALIAETADLRARIEARRAAEDNRLRAVAVPEYAVAAYTRWHGDAEAADEASDEQAAHAIRAWADAIEAQGLAMPRLPDYTEIHPAGA